MPYIQINLNKKIEQETETNIKEKLGKLIETIPGKTEKWLMVQINDDGKLYFRGKSEDTIAFVSIRIYGKNAPEVYSAFTGEITKLLCDEIDLKEDNIYVQYEECEYWGWNGKNFGYN